MKPWKCGNCLRANQGFAEQCYHCSGNHKLPILPVRKPNTQQNTPSYKDLVREIEIEELRRATTRSTEELLAELREFATSAMK